MKQLTYILIVVCFGFYVYRSFNQGIQPKGTNRNFKVIVNFEEDVISDATLYSTIDTIQNKNIRELLRAHGAVKLKAAYTNRYDTAGFLKPNY